MHSTHSRVTKISKVTSVTKAANNGLKNILQEVPAKVKGIRTDALLKLYKAKCEDLELHPKNDQFKRFLDFCDIAIQGRKINFREAGFGLKAAKWFKQILKQNGTSHLDVRKNLLGNSGLIELLSAVMTSYTLIHLDIGSNDVTFEGTN